MPTEDVVLRLRVVGQQAAASGMGKVADQTRRVGTEADKARKPTGKFTSSIKGMVGGFVGFAAASKLTKDAIGNAVDLGEQMNKTAVVFRGPGAKAIKDWSKTTATSLGISQRQALESTGVFGNMLVPMGIGRTRAADLSKHMVTLASDMASFNNASPEDTLDALRAGLAGETEPLRRYGVFLNQARIEQQAMSMGLWDGKGAIDAQAKALATAAIITKDTKDAHGDFQRTSSSLANQQRILKARYEEVTAQIGSKLLPILSFLVKNLDSVGIAVGALTAAWLAYKAAALVAQIQTIGLNAALLANPIGLILVALIALGAAFVIAYRKSKTFRNIVNTTWAAVKTAALWVGTNLVAAFNKLWPVIKQLPLIWLIRNFGKIVSTVRDMPGKISRAASGMWDGIKSAFGSAINAIIGVWNSLEFSVPGFDKGPIHFGGFTLGVPDISPVHLAEGGLVQRAGMALVGERGPELLSLPRGAAVAPLTGASRIEVPVYLDRRQIALAVADDASDRTARK